LFATFYAISLWKFHRSKNDNALYFTAASVAFGFFILATHMHENHLFHFFPLVAMVYFEDARLKWIILLLTGTFLTNMALHDPYLTHAFQRYGAGPRLVLPQPESKSPIFT